MCDRRRPWQGPSLTHWLTSLSPCQAVGEPHEHRPTLSLQAPCREGPRGVPTPTGAAMAPQMDFWRKNSVHWGGMLMLMRPSTTLTSSGLLWKVDSPYAGFCGDRWQDTGGGGGIGGSEGKGKDSKRGVQRHTCYVYVAGSAGQEQP